MKLATLLILSATSAALLLSSCSADPDVSVKRDTDELHFAYQSTSQTFTVRTAGNWSTTTEDAWIHTTPAVGTGDGNQYQYVQVTVDRNTGDKRLGKVILHAAGRDLTISVHQDDGLFALKKAYILGILLEGKSVATTFVAIPYEKALGTESMDVEITIDGEGSAGLKATNISGETLKDGDGEVLVALSGTPRSMGNLAITATIKLSTQSEPIVQLAQGFVSSENIIYEMTFDKLLWGGDYVANKTGIWPGNQNLDVTPATPANETATSGQDGSGDYFHSGMNPGFTAARGLSEWAGSKVYEHPGFPKMGTGTALGWIMSPKINFQALGLTEPQNIFVQFNYCRWDGEQDDIIVTAEGAGSMPDTRLIKDHPKRTWQNIIFKVTDATGETRIKVSGTKAGNNRFFIDNFRVYVSQTIPGEITSKLEIPSKVIAKDETASTLTFGWKQDFDASSYAVELYAANGTTLIKSDNAANNEYTFDQLTPNTEYKFRVMSNCQSKPEFSSDYSPLISITTPNPDPAPTPVISLYEATHGLLVFEWPRNDDYGRKFILELAETAIGAPIRTVECKQEASGFGFYANYPYNRFVFGGLEADKSYFCRVKVIGSGNYLDSTFGVCEAKTAKQPLLGAEVLLYKDFDDFWWGGYSIAAAFGVCPSSAMQKLPEAMNLPGSALVDNSDTAVAGPSKNADDTFATIGKVNASYLAARWSEGDWSTAGSSKIYEVCGHLKFGTGTAKGILALPLLTKIGDGNTAAIILTVKTCPYIEPKAVDGVYTIYGAQDNKNFTISISGGGTFDDGTTTKTLTNDDANRDNNGRFAWTQHTVEFINVTTTSRITISTIEKRMWLDEIKVVKK